MRKSLLLVLALAILMAACSPFQAGSSPSTFVPLPPPAGGRYPLAFQLQTVGKVQKMTLASPNAVITYDEYGSGSGKIANETVTIFPNGTPKTAVMLSTTWGDYLQGSVDIVEYNNPAGNLLGGMVLLELKKASILPWIFQGDMTHTINRSRLYLVYQAEEPGAWPMLSFVQYVEKWGSSDKDVWALGLTAHWNGDSSIVPAQYQRWGFWETKSTPFSVVTGALDYVANSVKSTPPDLLVEDRDSARELIGRQSGFDILKKGVPYGTIRFDYNNNWGRGPNTKFLGSGALSRIEWTLGEKYYTMLALTPQLSPTPSTLYLFLSDKSQADKIYSDSSNWPLLYDQIRQNQIKGFVLGVHAIGDVADITQTSTDKNGNTVTEKIGTGGGIRFTTIGNPSFSDITLARNLVSYLGQGGVDALGLYYPYAVGSGSGLDYYVATLVLMTAPNSLEKWGVDVGVIDRVGFPTVIQ